MIQSVHFPEQDWTADDAVIGFTTKFSFGVESLPMKPHSDGCRCWGKGYFWFLDADRSGCSFLNVRFCETCAGKARIA